MRGPWAFAALLLAAACGTGTDGKPVTPTTPAPQPPPLPELTAPTGLKVAELRSDERGYTWITGTWNSVPGVQEYLVGFRFDDDETEFADLVTEPSFTTPEGLGPGRLMHVRVRALRERVAGPWSEPVTGGAPPPPPEKPTGIRVADAGPDFILWTWDPVEGATSYLVSAFPTGEGFRPEDAVEVEVPAFRLDRLDLGDRYSIYLRAVRETAGGRAVGPWSEVGIGATRRSPLPPHPLFRDRRFDRTLWQELVFGWWKCHDDPSVCTPQLEARITLTLEQQPSFYISTHDDEGNSTFSVSEIATIRRAIPDAVEALTGRAFRGEVLWGDAPFSEEGWVTIVQYPVNEHFCGWAGLGWPAGLVRVVETVGTGDGSGCGSLSLRDLVLHEIGHALGFSHVTDTHHLMHPGLEVSDSSASERFHGRLAYELGRFHPYVDDRTHARTTTTALPAPEPVVIECPAPHGAGPW